ncbi:hypothetical protein ACIQWZ_18850 [Streptomyces sp. NPDC098077]|uniref:hypothetical protein n=1 Tax=Streptomyces sp. NPDC098077 TaxID=3366093 RepID=UPI00381B45F4
MIKKCVPVLTEQERLLLQHLADGCEPGELGPALGLSRAKSNALFAGMCDGLGSPRNPAALLAICYATEAVQPPDLLDPSDIAMPAEEQELLPLFAMGVGEHDMAAQLERKRWKVNQQAKNVLENLQVQTRAQAVHVAWQYGIVTATAISEWLEKGDSEIIASNLQPPGLGPVLYIQAREGEAVDTPGRCARRADPAAAMPLLSYWDQAADDRDARGALWARASEILSRSGQPVGQPLPGVHPARQSETMRRQRCRVGFCPARLEHTSGHVYLYLVTKNQRRADGSYRTAQPPVCIEHALLCAESEPRFQGGHTALLVTASNASGVLGTLYGPLDDGLNVAAVGTDQEFHPYADRDRLRWVLASRLVRDLTSYRVIDLRRLVREAFRTPPAPTSRGFR